MYKIKIVEKYIKDFFQIRREDFDVFYRTTHRDRTTGVYLLKHGTDLMDLIIDIHSNIEEQYCAEQLVPQHFATPEKLLYSLQLFKKYLNSKQYIFDDNFDTENSSYIVDVTQKMKDDLVSMIDYVTMLYDKESDNIPYQDLRFYLITRNIPDFIKTLKSILASVSYAIAKVQEGFFHSNVHLILKLLGFDILSEDTTNIGRIDAVIRFNDVIYIFEFKFGDTANESDDALNQIIEKKYAEKFIIEKKEIIAVGVSFGSDVRNINGFVFKNIMKV